MPGEYLPLFPLQMVLFPRAALPLHIFEERYKEMIGEAIRHNTEFGVVQAGEKGIVNTGTTAVVERVLRRHPDGRLDLLCVGRRRFEIILLNDEKDYLRAAVQFFDDEDPDPPDDDVRERALEAYRQLQEIESLPDADEDDPQVSFVLGNPVPDLEVKQVMLATKSEAERLRQLAEFLPGFVFRQRRLQHLRSVAPRNGYSQWSSVK